MTAYYNEKSTVYVITNRTNGKQYIGVTCRGVHRRWLAHLCSARKGVKTAFYNAIRKYGADMFVVEELACVLRRDDTAEIESLLIKQFNTKAPYGYNLTDGGDGVRGLPSDIVELIATKNRGRKQSDEAKRRIGEASKGHPVSAETRCKIGSSHRGKVLTEEHKAKLAAAKQGRKRSPRSPEHSRRISEGLYRAWEKKHGGTNA